MPTQTTIVHLLHGGPRPIIQAVQNETGRTLKMVLDDFVLASGNTGRLYFSRPDFSKYSTPATLVLAENAFTADLTQGLTRPGKVECQLKVTVSSQVVSTLTFTIQVERDVNGVTVSQLGYSIEDIQALAQQIEDAAEDIQDLMESFSIDKTLSTTSTNAVENRMITGALSNIEESLEPFAWKTYGYIDTGMVSCEDGTLLESTMGVYGYTEYIDISDYSSITYKQIVSGYSAASLIHFGMAFYTDELVFISGAKALPGSMATRHYVVDTIDVPSNAVYARFTCLTDPDEGNAFGLKKSTDFLGNTIDSIEQNLEFINDYLNELWQDIEIEEYGSPTPTYARTTEWERMTNYPGGIMIPRSALGSAIKVTGPNADKYTYSVVLFLTSNVCTEGTPVPYADYTDANGSNRFQIASGETRVIHIPSEEVAPYVWISTTFATRNRMKPTKVSILSGSRTSPIELQNQIDALRNLIVDSVLNNKTPVVAPNIEVLTSDDISEIVGSLDSDDVASSSSNNSVALFRDVPANRTVLNAYKKAHQLLDLTYVPKKQMVYDTDGGTTIAYHPANVPVTGMMYSSAKEVDKFVGINVSIRTFMTAVNNPNSVLYTECINQAHSATGYGKTYHGLNCGAYYGTICSGLISYALGLADRGYMAFTNETVRYLNDESIFERVYDSTCQGMQLMDVIWVPGHVRLVTDIYRDSRGTVKKVYVTESVHPVVREVVYSDLGDAQNTLADLDTYIATHQAQLDTIPGGVYRFRDLYQNTQYEQSPFVAITSEGETPQSYTYNNDICTYLGDYPCVSEWEDMYINFNKGPYDTLLVKTESGTQVGSYNLASYDDTLLLDSYGPGKFKACLHKGNNSIPDSDYTHWEVLDTTVSITNGSHMTFSSTNATPTYIRFAKYANSSDYGASLGALYLTDKNRKDGYVDFNYSALITEQGNTVPAHGLYAKLYFKGDYGVARCSLEDCCLIE